MIALFFLIYAAIGAGTWYGLEAYTEIGRELSVTAGAVTGIVLMQLHMMLTRGQDQVEEIEGRVASLERQTRDTGERMDVVEAKTEAVENTVKHELTERRDALVTEMKQLESLIDRLSHSFEAKLADAPTASMPPQDDAALRSVKDALLDGRVDLHLQPIVSLPQRRVSFYEGFTRLRRPDGSLILPAEFLDPARRAGLMGVIDNMSLFRCVQIVRRLAERDRRVGVFCNISSASLEDDQFFPHFHEFMMENRDLSGSVIFEIRADKFETRSRKMRDSMDKLTALGFRFSIDHAADLALDLPRLQDAGIRFVKMNGQRLIDDLRDPNGARPVSSINRQLSGEDVSAVFSRYGVTLVAEKLEDETSVVEILEFDIPYGQGHVFGAPRPIKSSLMAETAPPAEFIKRIGAFG